MALQFTKTATVSLPALINYTFAVLTEENRQTFFNFFIVIGFDIYLFYCCDLVQ